MGRNDEGQLGVGGWTNIVQAAAGRYHTVGLRANGTVVAVGNNLYWQLEVGDWANIVQIAAGDWHTVGLKANGTVVAEGMHEYDQCEVRGWNLGRAALPVGGTAYPVNRIVVLTPWISLAAIAAGTLLVLRRRRA